MNQVIGVEESLRMEIEELVKENDELKMERTEYKKDNEFLEKEVNRYSDKIKHDIGTNESLKQRIILLEKKLINFVIQLDFEIKG